MTQPLLSQDLVSCEIPPFLPAKIRRACAGKRVQFRIPAGVRESMQVPEDLDGAEWAKRHHRVTAIDAHPGPWRPELVPHTERALQLATTPYVRTLSLCWPERAAKTHVLLAAAKRTLDRGCESGNVFWLMPSEHEAKKAIGERVIPSLQASPRTARLLSRLADDTTRTLIRFRHGPRLFAAWAGSAASVASFYGKLRIWDETDKTDTSGVGKETDILTLFEKRGRDSDESKGLYASTPAQGYIYRLTMGSQRVEQYQSRCPHCRQHVSPREEHVIIPSGASAEDVKNGDVLVSMVCPSCGVEWTSEDRKAAYLDGAWIILKGADVERPETVGLHMTAYILPNIPLKEIAEKILLAKQGGDVEKKALANGYDCKNYQAEQKSRQEDHILRLIDPHLPRHIVPRDTNSIIIYADTQKHGFFYEVVAFGWGRDLTSWIIDHGYVERFEHLTLLQDRDWFDADGNRYRARTGFIDSGGGATPSHPKHSRTREVYDFCIENPFWHPLKGKQRQTTPVSWTRLDFFPGNDGRKVPIPGGLVLYTLDTTYYKNMLARKLDIDPGNPGGCHLHAGLTIEEMESWKGPHDAIQEGRQRWQAYAKQMCAESQDDRGYWINPNNAANHHWDIGTYRYAGADILMLGDEKKMDEIQQPEQPASNKMTMTKTRRW